MRWTGKITLTLTLTPGFWGLEEVGDVISIAGAKERSRLQGQWDLGHREGSSEGEEQVREIQIWCPRDPTRSQHSPGQNLFVNCNARFHALVQITTTAKIISSPSTESPMMRPKLG